MDTLRQLHALLGLARWLVTIVVLLASGTTGTDERETRLTGTRGSLATLACSIYQEGPGTAVFSGNDGIRVESHVTIAPDGRQLVSSVTVSRHGGGRHDTTITVEVAHSGTVLPGRARQLGVPALPLLPRGPHDELLDVLHLAVDDEVP